MTAPSVWLVHNHKYMFEDHGWCSMWFESACANSRCINNTIINSKSLKIQAFLITSTFYYTILLDWSLNINNQSVTWHLLQQVWDSTWQCCHFMMTLVLINVILYKVITKLPQKSVWFQGRTVHISWQSYMWFATSCFMLSSWRSNKMKKKMP